MLSVTLFQFFSSFTGFQPQVNAHPVAEFRRLAESRNWTKKSVSGAWRKNWRRLQELMTAKTRPDEIDDIASRFGGVSLKHDDNSTSEEEEPFTVASVLRDAQAFLSSFGTTTNLNALVLGTMCEDLGIDPIPDSNAQRKKALEVVHVNIYDYLRCKKRHVKVGPIFYDLKEFRKYTNDSNKIFPRAVAKKNKSLRLLLRVLH